MQTGYFFTIRQINFSQHCSMENFAALQIFNVRTIFAVGQ
ncbi:hypothetical protein CFter6_2715 [Collimonas fungivorans]|uniref:Uncharacterized protein n=1 Tax=Collimonas fungivorans TaxID=158899 RepID=A0A127PCD8_9BURK|nr:hypothetical protein CFter6_2715 [Collimonas fungivorans]